MKLLSFWGWEAAGLKMLGPSDTYGLTTSTIAEQAKRYTHAQSIKRWDEIKGCSLAKINLGDPMTCAEEISGDSQKKPTLSSRISDCPLSNKETPTYYNGASGHTSMCEQEDETRVIVDKRVCVRRVLANS